MAGHPNPNIYFSDRYPTPLPRRPTNLELCRLLIDTGWPRNMAVLVNAVAVVNAESMRDPRGYLAYVNLHTSRYSTRGLALRAEIDSWPAHVTLTAFRVRLHEIGCDLYRADCGLFQIGKPPHEATVGQLMDSRFNCRLALKIWKENGRTFNPWAAYTTPRKEGESPPYRWYLAAAEQAAEQALR
jgi:hypothetical protein